MMVFDVVIKPKYFGVTFIIEALVQSLPELNSVEMCYVKASVQILPLYLCFQFKFEDLIQNINVSLAKHDKNNFNVCWVYLFGDKLKVNPIEQEVNWKWTGSEPEVSRKWIESESEVNQKWTNCEPEVNTELTPRWPTSASLRNES